MDAEHKTLYLEIPLDEFKRLHAEVEGLRALNDDQTRFIDKLQVELTHRVGWEERALRAEAALQDVVKSTGGALIVQDYARLNQALGQQ